MPFRAIRAVRRRRCLRSATSANAWRPVRLIAPCVQAKRLRALRGLAVT
jgi:hypothetical protein